MKKLSLLIILLFALSSSAFAKSVTVGWDPTTDPSVTAYNIYTSTVSGSYTFGAAIGSPGGPVGQVAVPNVTYQIATLPTTGPLYMVVTAINAAGVESLPSNEILAPIPPSAPKNLKVVGL